MHRRTWIEPRSNTLLFGTDMGDAKAKPLVSICMPTFNGGRFLAEALDSALAQTHTDFELLICDDGSQDDTLRTVTTYARRDSRVRVHRNPQRLGLAGNWNRCLELSRGEWIKFLFQDDYLAPTCLERLLALCAERACDVAACDRHLVFEPSVSAQFKRTFQRYVDTHAPSRHFSLDANVISAGEFTRHVVKNPLSNCIGEPTAVIFRRSLVRRFGHFNTHLQQLPDWEYWMRLGTHTGVGYLPDKLAAFRLHGNATTLHNQGPSGERVHAEDGLIIRHELVYSPHYAALRAATGASCQLRKGLLRQYLAARSVFARHARRAADPQESELIRARWKQLVLTYPRLRFLPLKYLPIGACAKVRALLARADGG